MAPIVLSNVTKILKGGVEAVRDVSFEIPSGAACAIVGPTGCGKSTLLRLIASREAPSGGMIEVGDDVSQSWRLGRPELVELVDPAALDPELNVYDSIARGLRAHGLKRAEAEASALAAADAMTLGAVMARRAGRLSDGERARTALARALARRPRAFVFDEPFRGLDDARKAALRAHLTKLRKETGVTMAFALHDQTDALALADVLAVMDAGRLVAFGQADELYARPPSAAAARLVGAPPMNVLPVRANQTGLSLEDGTHLGGASVMTSAVFADLGVRPEDLFAMGDGAPPAAAVFPMAVDLVERAGAGSFVHGRVGAFPFFARLAGRVAAPAIGPLRLGARRESLHMFDAETGARL